jgi:hypothetical protein
MTTLWTPVLSPASPARAAAGPSDAAVAAAAEEEEEERLPAGQAPPVDLWAKASECLAWAGDGQCKANEVRCPSHFAAPHPRSPLTPVACPASFAIGLSP